MTPWIPLWISPWCSYGHSCWGWNLHHDRSFHHYQGGVAVDSPVSGGKIAAFVQQRFGYAVYDTTTGTFPTAAYFSTSGLTNDGGGAYHLTDTLDFDITATTTEVYSYITQDPVLNAGSYDGEDGHIQLYREVFNAGQKPGVDFTYTSAADVASCENVTGLPI